MKFFSKAWYDEMQVRGFMVFHETKEDWLEDVAWHAAEGISFEERAKDNIDFRKAELLKYLPPYFHASILDGTIKTAYPAPEFLEQVRRWCGDYDKRMEVLSAEYRKGFEAIKDKLPANAVQLVENTLHDAQVISYALPAEDIVEIILDCSGGYHYQCDIRLRFTGVSAVSLPEQLERTYWAYDEIYRVEQGFELRVLLDAPLSELILTARDVSFEMLSKPQYMM